MCAPKYSRGTGTSVTAADCDGEQGVGAGHGRAGQKRVIMAHDERIGVRQTRGHFASQVRGTRIGYMNEHTFDGVMSSDTHTNLILVDIFVFPC